MLDKETHVTSPKYVAKTITEHQVDGAKLHGLSEAAVVAMAEKDKDKEKLRLAYQRVDFPAPLGPSSAQSSPSYSVPETLFKICFPSAQKLKSSHSSTPRLSSFAAAA